MPEKTEVKSTLMATMPGTRNITYCCPSDVALTTELRPKPRKTRRKSGIAMLPTILLFDRTYRFMLRSQIV